MKSQHAIRLILLALAVTTAAPAAMAGDPAKPKEVPEYPADNTGRNVRDRDGDTLTPGDQSGSEADRELVAKIREEVVGNDSLSMKAHNVKIISVDGMVTLRGPVESDAERKQIAATAERFAGAGKVKNQLEIAR
jgi:osmotically-inducible protein OsmY